MLAILSSQSRWELGREEKDRYSKLSTDAIFDILTHRTKAGCIRKDPTGRENLRLAKSFRKKLKSIKKDKDRLEDELERALGEFAVRRH